MVIGKSKIFRAIYPLLILIALSLPFFAVIPAFADTANPDGMNITNIYIWRNVLATGDFLAVAVENVSYSTIPPLDISETFLFRFMSDNLTTEYGSVQAYPYHTSGYGKGVVSWYFSAASNMTWQGTYKIRIEGKVSAFTTPPSYNYQVPASAYSSANTSATIKEDITTKVISIATSLQNAWGSNYTLIESAGNSIVLTAQGETYFTQAIPSLQIMAPNLFTTTIDDPSSDNPTWSTNASDTWEASLSGSAQGGRMQDFADLFSVSFLTMAAIPILIVGAVLVVAGAATGNILSGFMNAALLIDAASYYGWFPPIAMILISFACGVYVLWHFLGKGSP